ncbi:Calmodulin-1 [Hondaea fermentalgiana]|uniref:Calmodulin-1 n=1 Tax=Hondaea fermentalgiana TaxID=2315210 RepID=A0A2R5GMF7_9STRA|nr:Calmodulin-1 [Hondaea fermentalgiana]|eukprot:GBG31815.1 Calmodulin-1 [Hondaea fermentalgiana]
MEGAKPIIPPPPAEIPLPQAGPPQHEGESHDVQQHTIPAGQFDELDRAEALELPPAQDAEDNLEPVVKVLPKLVPGQLVVEVVEAYGLSKDEAAAAITQTRIDPYLKCTLGKQKKAPTHKGRVLKNQGKDVPFNEKMVFNLVDPEPFASEGDVTLTFKIMNSNVLADTTLAEAEISVSGLFVNFQHEGEYRLFYRRRKSDPLQPAGGVKLRMRFYPARMGYLLVHCMEGRKMKNMELMGKQDPYCKFEMLDQKPQRSKTIKNGGTDCSFDGEELRLWLKSNTWTEQLHFSCFDEDIGSDDLIGARNFNLLEFMTDASTMEEFDQEGMGRIHEEWYEIFQGRNMDKLSGEVRLRFQFYPAGTLVIQSIEARHLVDKDTMGRQDPYIVYMMKSNYDTSNFKMRTKTDTDGGTDPRWDETSKMAVVDHHELVMEVYDEDTIGSDDLIGKASFSLLPLFRKGVLDTWVTLRNKDTWGRVTKCGEVHLHLEFIAPPGVAYPLLQPDMDTFDDTERENRLRDESDEQAAVAKDSGFGKGAFVNGRPPGSTDEFTDADIESAFQFIDLNKNGFIGAGEIRHILVCMGELITDEEVDEMVRMVDSDGDGQVSFAEFRLLMLHPDPANFDASTVKDIVEAAPGTAALGLDGKDVAARQEQDAATKREKINLMRLFSQANEVSMPTLQRAFEKFRLLDRGAGSTGFVDFPTMCDILLVEPTGEYKKLFKLMDYEGQARVNMREILLGLCNFANAPLETRCNFCFLMYDEDGNGSLDRTEITEILKANHLVSDPKAVRRKVDTVMQQADRDGSGTVDIDEFLILAKKFPNLLFAVQLDSTAD